MRATKIADLSAYESRKVGILCGFVITSRKDFIMIILRQGKAKSILDGSINSALTAVETYNRPRTMFRIENYIVLMIIAWTKLFHAFFQSEIGEKYFYKEKNGRYKKLMVRRRRGS